MRDNASKSQSGEIVAIIRPGAKGYAISAGITSTLLTLEALVLVDFSQPLTVEILIVPIVLLGLMLWGLGRMRVTVTNRAVEVRPWYGRTITVKFDDISYSRLSALRNPSYLRIFVRGKKLAALSISLKQFSNRDVRWVLQQDWLHLR